MNQTERGLMGSASVWTWTIIFGSGGMITLGRMGAADDNKDEVPQEESDDKNVDLNISLAKKKSNVTTTAYIKNSVQHSREIEQALGRFLLRPCIEKMGRIGLALLVE